MKMLQIEDTSGVVSFIPYENIDDCKLTLKYKELGGRPISKIDIVLKSGRESTYDITTDQYHILLRLLSKLAMSNV